MTLKRRFAAYNIIMLTTPIILIGVVSVGFLVVFIMKYPVEELSIGRAALINPRIFAHALGSFFQKNPSALSIVVIWALICTAILITTTTVFTMHMSRSIQKPIENLKKAAECVTNGNLDFEVMGSDYDEIDALCAEFDSMRKNMKSSKAREKMMNTERSMLLANLSHDLKTPVTSIKGYIEGIRDGVADTPEKMQRYLDTIYNKAELIDDMVNNLSVYSKLELSRISFHFEYGNLGEFLMEYCEERRMDLEHNGISFGSEYGDGGILVKLDYEQMSRVFANVIDNAIKYKNGDSGKLFVRTYAGDGGVYAEISDSGIGIKKKELDNVFESFYRVDEARTLNIKGSGLGLGIAKQIVEHHGGKIWLRSNGENMGTMVEMYLPQAKGAV